MNHSERMLHCVTVNYTYLGELCILVYYLLLTFSVYSERFESAMQCFWLDRVTAALDHCARRSIHRSDISSICDRGAVEPVAAR